MGSFFDKMLKMMEQNRFCYANPNGEGFRNKEECECHCNGVLNCQAYQDMQRFHSHFEGLTYEESIMKRREIIERIRDDFKDSQWYKDNVIE